MVPRRNRAKRLTRDTVLFTVGLLGVAHETLVPPDPRSELLLAFMAMMGLPAYIRADEARRESSDSRRVVKSERRHPPSPDEDMGV